ncbi:hypothetical protein TNIN_381641 [Trichonephila inaurata madagascariensis]|uniref:Uncharacterized protein n=1 Tax=Trichonephila inaurata madagascariensis TaxID=2747483 RepID=A0A8X6WXL9_9ARAC|nr:hypothetical protein TNIN_381641 [Trichonephila inaurata madagascariensis]
MPKKLLLQNFALKAPNIDPFSHPQINLPEHLPTIASPATPKYRAVFPPPDRPQSLKQQLPHGNCQIKTDFTTRSTPGEPETTASQKPAKYRPKFTTRSTARAGTSLHSNPQI